MGNFFCYILNGYIKRATEEYKVIGEEQNGFREDKRGKYNIYIIREIIDVHKRERKPLYLAFLDIEKAYDKVNRKTLIYILNKIGLPQKIVNLISSIYRNTKSKYIFGDIMTGWVNLERGVRQGCVLSPLLFSIYTEELAARIRNSGLGVKVNEDRLGSLLYAHDVVLIGENEKMLQNMLNNVRTYGSEFSLSFNSNKCGVMICNKPEEGIEDFRLGNQIIKRVKEYNYSRVFFFKRRVLGKQNLKEFLGLTSVGGDYGQQENSGQINMR